LTGSSLGGEFRHLSNIDSGVSEIDRRLSARDSLELLLAIGMGCEVRLLLKPNATIY
jgi:hypothetical protein